MEKCESGTVISRGILTYSAYLLLQNLKSSRDVDLLWQAFQPRNTFFLIFASQKKANLVYALISINKCVKMYNLVTTITMKRSIFFCFILQQKQVKKAAAP